MIDLITFLDNNVRLAIYTGGNIHELYRYLEIIGDPTNLTSSVQCYHHFCTSSSTNNDKATLNSVIAYLRI